MNNEKNNTGKVQRPLWVRVALLVGVVLLGIALAWQFLLSYGASRGFEMTATVIQATNEAVSTAVVATRAAATDIAASRSGSSAIDLTVTVVLGTDLAEGMTSSAQRQADTSSIMTSTPLP
jgi:hypothetical protein